MTERIFEAQNRASSLLQAKGLDPHTAQILMQFITQKTGATYLMDLRNPLTEEEQTTFWNQTEQLLKGIPVQYVIGTETFYGRPFEVNKNVLIPRPETEELIQEALRLGKEFFGNDPIKVADIGTGSGAIAVTFKKEWENAIVTATDISREALTVAKRNADRHKVDITFLEGDLAEPLAGQKWDIILSNPPYIAEAEAMEMSDVVLKHEPHNALFAEENGLYFYRKLAEQLPSLMNKRSIIGLEIGYKQGTAVRDLFQKAFPKAFIEIKKDINGKDRMIFCKIGE